MVTIYKWAIGALTTIVLFFGSAYINSVQYAVQEQSKQIMAHEQRITTLEESKRNTEAMLRLIQQDITSIRNAVVK